MDRRRQSDALPGDFLALLKQRQLLPFSSESSVSGGSRIVETTATTVFWLLGIDELLPETWLCTTAQTKLSRSIAIL